MPIDKNIVHQTTLLVTGRSFYSVPKNINRAVSPTQCYIIVFSLRRIFAELSSIKLSPLTPPLISGSGLPFQKKVGRYDQSRLVNQNLRRDYGIFIKKSPINLALLATISITMLLVASTQK